MAYDRSKIRETANALAFRCFTLETLEVWRRSTTPLIVPVVECSWHWNYQIYENDRFRIFISVIIKITQLLIKLMLSSAEVHVLCNCDRLAVIYSSTYCRLTALVLMWQIQKWKFSNTRNSRRSSCSRKRAGLFRHFPAFIDTHDGSSTTLINFNLFHRGGAESRYGRCYVRQWNPNSNLHGKSRATEAANAVLAVWKIPQRTISAITSGTGGRLGTQIEIEFHYRTIGSNLIVSRKSPCLFLSTFYENFHPAITFVPLQQCNTLLFLRFQKEKTNVKSRSKGIPLYD